MVSSLDSAHHFHMSIAADLDYELHDSELSLALANPTFLKNVVERFSIEFKLIEEVKYRDSWFEAAI
jgi:hypothetical protein